MGANDWHKEKPFRTKLLRSGGLSPDDAFTRAIEAGYFPELQARDFDAAHLPDLDIFHEAVSQELHGKPRFTPGGRGRRRRGGASRALRRRARRQCRTGRASGRQPHAG
jgi:hypothetical protein